MKNTRNTERRQDLLTVPNAMTIARAASIPMLYKMIKNDPGKNWWKAGVVASSDKADGLAASQEDKGPHWKKLGFRRSNFGRIMDPVVDTIFGASMMYAGMESGAIPKRIGQTGIAQKAAKTAVSGYATVGGHELYVSYTGKLGEFITVSGFGFRMGAEGINDPLLRSAAKVGSGAVAWAGIGLSSVATIGYARDGGILAPERTNLEDSVEQFSERIVTLPKMIMQAIRGQSDINTTT